MSSSAVFESLRAARLRAVGTHFLRLRPLVALVAGTLNVAIFLHADASPLARVGVPLCLGSLLGFFVGEGAILRTREASESWLFTSLVITAVLLGVGCAVSGGAASPILPLLLTPIVVGFAAFGRTTKSHVLFALGGLVLIGLAALSATADVPGIDPAHARAMAVVTTLASLVLVRIGVAELAESYVETGRALDRLRLDVLDESLRRARDAESLGQRVAHEVKNPLTSIKGLGQLLRQDLSGERAQKRLDVLLAEVERVDALARGYLSLSRPLHDLRPETVDLAALVADLVTLLEARAKAANVELVIRGERTLPLEADPRRVREALLNLAENALRAMPDGGTLAFVIEARPSGARVLVEDEGIGASDEALAALGRPFEPGGDGTGLGVAIARGAIGQHGGTLAFERRVPRGLRAIVSLPRAPGASEPA